jgi:hypothetical protein
LYLFVVIFFHEGSALERAEPINHHPVLSKTLFLFGYLKYLTPLHLKFAHESYLILISRLQKYVEYMRAFHLLERSFFCEGGGANKKTHFKSHVLASPVQLATKAMA